MFQERPIVAAVHHTLIEELKIRQRQFEEETLRPSRGGLTTFSQLAAQELKAIRLSGEDLIKEILKLKEIRAEKFVINGTEKEYIPYEYFKKLYLYASALGKKKDQKQFHIEVQKIKGINKNEVKCLW